MFSPRHLPPHSPVLFRQYVKTRQIIENALFPHLKNSDLPVSSHVYRNNSEKFFTGGAGVAEKTSLGSLL